MVVVTSVRLRDLELAQFWREVLRVLARADSVAIVRGMAPPIPDLYATRVRYQQEPNAGRGIEDLADPWTVLERGWGDCDDLLRYRLCQCYVAGEMRAGVAIANQDGTGLQHAMLRRANGALEDPSRILLDRQR